LDDSVERDVLAHDELSRFGSAPRWSRGNQTLAARPATPPCLEDQPVSFAGPPGVILDGFDEVFVDAHGVLLLLIGVVSHHRRKRSAPWQTLLGKRSAAPTEGSATIVIVPSRSTKKNAA
jgi:hypothetical protein